jgi:hypothetical protein
MFMTRLIDCKMKPIDNERAIQSHGPAAGPIHLPRNIPGRIPPTSAVSIAANRKTGGLGRGTGAESFVTRQYQVRRVVSSSELFTVPLYKLMARYATIAS